MFWFVDFLLFLSHVLSQKVNPFRTKRLQDFQIVFHALFTPLGDPLFLCGKKRVMPNRISEARHAISKEKRHLDELTISGDDLN